MVSHGSLHQPLVLKFIQSDENLPIIQPSYGAMTQSKVLLSYG